MGGISGSNKTDEVLVREMLEKVTNLEKMKHYTHNKYSFRQKMGNRATTSKGLKKVPAKDRGESTSSSSDDEIQTTYRRPEGNARGNPTHSPGDRRVTFQEQDQEITEVGTPERDISESDVEELAEREDTDVEMISDTEMEDSYRTEVAIPEIEVSDPETEERTEIENPDVELPDPEIEELSDEEDPSVGYSSGTSYVPSEEESEEGEGNEVGQRDRWCLRSSSNTPESHGINVIKPISYLKRKSSSSTSGDEADRKLPRDNLRENTVVQRSVSLDLTPSTGLNMIKEAFKKMKAALLV